MRLAPVEFDRVLGTRFGVAAVEAIERGDFNRMVSLKTPDVVTVPLEDVVGGQNLVDPNGQIVHAAKSVGICFGD